MKKKKGCLVKFFLIFGLVWMMLNGTMLRSEAAEKAVTIISFAELEEQEFTVEEKKTLEDIKEILPKEIKAFTEEGNSIELSAAWECIGDYDGTNYYYYEFQPVLSSEIYEISKEVDLPYVWVKIQPQERLLREVTKYSNETVIFQFLIEELKCNTATAVGILANLERESSFNPAARYPATGEILYYGICQWGGSRYEDLKQYCEKNGYSHAALEGQLKFLQYELNHSEKNAWKQMQGIENSAEGAYTAGYRWARYFERCASVYYEVSAKRARDVYWPAYLETEAPVYRIYGSDRYDTGIEIADRLKEVLNVNKLNSVVLTNGSGFADALSGSYLAYKRNAAILLINEKNADKILGYVKKNMKAVGTVYILGGEGAVPKSVELKFKDFNVKRLQGATRYETNLEILKSAQVDTTELLVCTGKNFADSLSASASGKPILLVADSLQEEQKAYLKKMGIQKFFIIGGTGAVSERVEKELSEYGSCTRVSGNTRYATSAAVADKWNSNAKTVLLTYGKNFPDGLCGGPLAAKSRAALLLVTEGNENDAKTYVSRKKIREGFVLGGSGLIKDSSVRKIFGLKITEKISKY